MVGVDAVREAVALSGGAVPALRTALAQRPGAGIERALLALAVGADYSDAVLRDQLIRAYADAADGRKKSLVRGVFLHTHRHYRLAADHLVGHFARYPADPPAVLLLSAFALAGDLHYREQGHRVVEQQYALAGSESWPWVSWLAVTRAEQGRVQQALELADQAWGCTRVPGPPRTLARMPCTSSAMGWPRWLGWMTGWHQTRSFPNAGTCTGTPRCSHWRRETSRMPAVAPIPNWPPRTSACARR